MTETTSPGGGADTLAPTSPAPTPTAEPKQTIILGQPAGDTSIRPFSYHATDDDLADLKRRIAATRWPDRETVDDDSQGVQLATMQKLADYWANEYDWRKVEARLNAFPNFITKIDGLDIHFIHVRSKHENALPIIITHGWPGIDRRATEDHRAADRPDRARRDGGGRLRRHHPVDARIRFF